MYLRVVRVALASNVNAGFMAVEQLAQTCGGDFRQMKFRSDCGEAMVGGVRCLLMKPTTYMNNSGEAVAAAANFYKIPPEHVLVMYDDKTGGKSIYAASWKYDD